MIKILGWKNTSCLAENSFFISLEKDSDIKSQMNSLILELIFPFDL
jgi:hypothetical protein